MSLRAWLCALALAWVAPVVVQAQGYVLREARDASVNFELDVRQIVPWRVFTLAEPARLVVDIKDPALEFSAGALPPAVASLRVGALDAQWSRIVMELSGPMQVASAELRAVGDSAAKLMLRLEPSSLEAFMASVGAPEGAGWQMVPTASAPVRRASDLPLVVIDPGHGGVDPGAMRDGVVEADLMLAFGQELAKALEATGEFETLLTRSADVFVPLTDRMSIARAAGASVFVSIHADALDDPSVSGASVYTLSEEAVDHASAQLAQRLNRADLLAGVDLTGQDDTVSMLLMDMARRETTPASERLAGAIVAGWQTGGAVINSRPHRHAELWVLNAPDFPSVLVEAGFLSNPQDRVRLDTQLGRAVVINGLVAGLRVWGRAEGLLKRP